jgi:hypothetical protein
VIAEPDVYNSDVLSKADQNTIHVFDGYFTATVAGDYEFIVSADDRIAIHFSDDAS